MSKRIKVKLDDFIDEIISTNEHFIIGSYTDESGVLRNINLLTNDLFKDYSDSFFYDRTLPVKIGDDEDIGDGVIRVFEEHWESFLADNEHNFDRIAEALYTYYNPLWNYNKNQHTINIRTGSETLENETTYGATQVDNTKSGSDQMVNQYGATSDTLTKSGTEEIEREYGATTDTLSKSGTEEIEREYGATTDTLRKSGTEEIEREYGATTDTLSKSGTEQLTNQHGATEKHTTESGAFTDTHNIGAKETISSATTYDSGTFLNTGKVNEAARVDSDVRTYNNHDVEETEAIHTDTETKSFNDYQETTSGALHTDTESKSFNNYQETTSGALHTDTESKSFNNYQETTSGALHTDTESRSFNNYQETTNGAARTDTATRSFNNYKETTSGASHVDNGEETKTYNNVKDEFTDDTHGNIGVMESVTMIESELRLRSKQIGLDLLTKFYDTYTYRV
ncbi:MAG: hypothetical protein VZR54_09500 [Ruminococcus sp.]|nr:hypothetical protein [Ruminococcus sp.]